MGEGDVENKEGYLRCNELVPIPKFEELSLKNKELLKACDKDMQREIMIARIMIL